MGSCGKTIAGKAHQFIGFVWRKWGAPHFRHSKAVHMLEAGINIVYIRDFLGLGHEDISTTMIYVRTDNRLRNEAINKLSPKVTDETDLPDWNRDKDLMGFLNSLK
jgi:integrase/recombinase XerD